MTRGQLRLDDRRFNRLALGVLGTGFALLIVALAVIVLSADANRRANERVDHTYQVTNSLSDLMVAVERTETAVRGYLLQPDIQRARTHVENAALIEPALDELGRLTLDNPRQQAAIAAMRPKILDQVALNAQIMGDAQRGDLALARAKFSNRAQARQISQIRQISDAMHDEEERLLAERKSSERSQASILQMVLGGTGVLLLLVGLAAFGLVRRYTIDLTRTRDRLNLLNTDLEGAVAERTADLTRANEEIQRFAYIVSHDLRSPLVNILGFTAELDQADKAIGSLLDRAQERAPDIVTDDSRNAREDLREAIGFIRSSTQKMDRLINAILRLSREGRRTLTPEHLPMAAVMAEIVASLEHRLAETGTAVTVETPIPDIVGDRVAIEQIFSNLIENAVKYLQPGRPGAVTVRGRKQGERIIFEVEDNGRGIDAKDHERIFDLFRRSGAQDQPGEGIGLAHVRALAYRLGGFIDVQSELGQGATFQVNLPVTYADQGAAQ